MLQSHLPAGGVVDDRNRDDDHARRRLADASAEPTGHQWTYDDADRAADWAAAYLLDPVVAYPSPIMLINVSIQQNTSVGRCNSFFGVELHGR